MKILLSYESFLGFFITWRLQDQTGEIKVKDKNLKSAFKEFCRLTNAKYSEEAWLNWIAKAIKTIPESYKNKIQ